MENNIDTQLELAISTRNTYNESEAELYIGYSSEKSTWQLLIRYNDDISDLVERYRMQIYYLLAGYAIIEISEAYLNAFAADPRIIYIDKPKSVEQQVSYAQYASCLSGTFINNYGLDGDGTIFAIIDSELIIDIMNLSGMEKAEFYLFGISRRYIRIHMQILISWDVFIQMKN